MRTKRLSHCWETIFPRVLAYLGGVRSGRLLQSQTQSVLFSMPRQSSCNRGDRVRPGQRHWKRQPPIPNRGGQVTPGLCRWQPVSRQPQSRPPGRGNATGQAVGTTVSDAACHSSEQWSSRAAQFLTHCHTDISDKGEIEKHTLPTYHQERNRDSHYSKHLTWPSWIGEAGPGSWGAGVGTEAEVRVRRGRR